MSRWLQGWLATHAGILCLCFVIPGSGLAAVESTTCQDSLVRFLTQMYLTGAYCTCSAQHHEVVTTQGLVRRQVQYTLPGLTIRQRGLPDLSQVLVRIWGKIVDGPGGVYALSVRLHTLENDTQAVVRHVEDIHQGQEFEITGGLRDRILLRTRTPYHLMIEARNPDLHPQQKLMVQGRACFYLVSRP